MIKFTTMLNYTRLTDKWVILDNDLTLTFTLGEILRPFPHYLKRLLKKTGLDADTQLFVIAPRGFVTDLASIPLSMRWLFRPDGEYAPAAVIHDIIYQLIKDKTFNSIGNAPIERLNRLHTRLVADRLFLFAMRELGIRWATRYSLYSAVRTFGERHYNGEPVLSDYGIALLWERAPLMENFPIFRLKEEEGVPELTWRCYADGWSHHSVKYPNLKRAFVYPVDAIPARVA